MLLKKNIIANYVGMVGLAVIPLLALPWYLSALGPRQFGLIAFISMLQAVLALLDAGMSQALVREIAVRSSLVNGISRIAELFVGLERIYWIFAFGAGLVMALLADFLSSDWLNLGELPSTSGSIAIYGAAAIFALQFPGSIYRSLLVGVQAQVVLNSIILIGILLRHLGGVVVVLEWPTIFSYLLWHAAIALIETLIRGHFAWKTLGVQRKQFAWNIKELHSIWKTVMGMSGAVWLGALTVQMDKIVLSRMTGIEEFGYYAIASSVAIGALQLIHPLTQAVLPRAIQLRADNRALRVLLVRLSLLIGLLTSLGLVLFLIFGKWLLEVWLHNAQVAETVFPLLSTLLLGTLLNAFYNVGYIYWVVRDEVQCILQVNTISLLVAGALIPPLVSWYGVIGAAAGWVTINLIGSLLSLGWLKDTAR